MPTLGLLAVAALSFSPAGAADSALPKIGNVRVLSRIDPVTQGVTDTDTYSGVLMQGERVQAIIRRTGTSTLTPSVALLGPDGSPAAVTVRISSDGGVARFSRYTVPESGPYSVLVGGVGGTSGDYEAWLSVERSRSDVRTPLSLTEAGPTLLHRISATDGAKISVIARWSPTEAPLHIASVTDPSGNPVPGATGAVVNGEGSFALRDLVLSGGAGDYVLRVERQQGVAGTTAFSLRTKTTTPPRPKARNAKWLRSPEPRLEPVTEPVAALPGTNVSFEGSNFSTDGEVTVQIGDEDATVLSVTETQVDVAAPQGQPGTVQTVTIVNADGQSDQKPSYFQYLTPDTFPKLQAGSGFGGATAQPPAVGSGAGSDARVIARWDAVPFATLTGTHEVGVVAFHMNGIDRVEFSLDGGSWTAARDLLQNPKTGVFEYSVAIDTALLSDGPHEVRAVAYPTAGVPRVLGGSVSAAACDSGVHSFFFHTNVNGTLNRATRWVDSVSGSDTTGDGTETNPFKGVGKALIDIHTRSTAPAGHALDGATIYLKAGSYAWSHGPASVYPKNTEDWVTIQPAPGVTRSQVVFDSGDVWGFLVPYVRVKDVTLRGKQEFSSDPAKGTVYLWVDGCNLEGPGKEQNVTPYRGAQFNGVWVTDTTLRAYTNGTIVGTFARNVRAFDLLSDGYTLTKCILNCSVDGIDAGTTGSHADVYQVFGPGSQGSLENLILYGLKAVNCEAQGIFIADLTSIRDLAFVNVLIARPASANYASPPVSQWGVPATHVVMRGVSLPNSGFFLNNPQMTNVSIAGCVFAKLYTNPVSFPQVPDSWFRSNHFTDSTSYGAMQRGSDRSIGDPGYTDASIHDYTPKSTSVLRSRVQSLLAPTDVDGRVRTVPDTVGAVK